MTDFELLLHELGQLPEQITRARVIALMRSFAGRRISIDPRVFKRLEEQRIAAGLLTEGMERAQVSYALQERLGVSERTAERIVMRAITIHRPVRPPRQETTK
jgi:hypothetical protein